VQQASNSERRQVAGLYCQCGRCQPAGASATIVGANTLRLDNVMVQGVRYKSINGRWNAASRGFSIVATH